MFGGCGCGLYQLPLLVHEQLGVLEVRSGTYDELDCRGEVDRFASFLALIDLLKLEGVYARAVVCVVDTSVNELIEVGKVLGAKAEDLHL